MEEPLANEMQRNSAVTHIRPPMLLSVDPQTMESKMPSAAKTWMSKEKVTKT